MSGAGFRGRDRYLLFGGWLLSTLGAAVVVAAICAWRGAWISPWWLAPVLLGAAWHRWMLQPGGVPILMYHSVSDAPDWLADWDEISVSPATFDRQLGMLRDLGCEVVPTASLVEMRRSGEALADSAVAIHFDDGYLDTWVAAAPILQRHGDVATVFVVLDRIEPEADPRPTLEELDSGRITGDEVEWSGYLNWTELELLSRLGPLDVQAHGRDHAVVEIGAGGETAPSLAARRWLPAETAAAVVPPVGRRPTATAAAREGRLESEQEYAARVESELRDCRTSLERRLGTRIDLFCWPELAYTETGRRLAAKVGYRATATGWVGDNRADEDPTLLSRIHAGERALGWHWRWADDLTFRASLRVAQGNRYWMMALAPVRLIGRVVRTLRAGIINR